LGDIHEISFARDQYAKRIYYIQLDIRPCDVRIIKTYGNAFNKTSLFSELERLEIDTAIISGYCAEYCVLNTYRGARDVDLKPILLRGSLASDHPERIRFVEEINEVISLGALKNFIS
jgi:nicotinamidase-related amidase